MDTAIEKDLVANFFRQHGFDKKGDIIKSKGRLEFRHTCNDADVKDIVYMWVIEEDKSPVEIIYIGQSGKTLQQRCASQKSGLDGGSKKGIKHAKELKNLLKAGKRIAFYSRTAEHGKAFDIVVSLREAEERALLEVFKMMPNLLNGRKKKKK